MVQPTGSSDDGTPWAVPAELGHNCRSLRTVSTPWLCSGSLPAAKPGTAEPERSSILLSANTLLLGLQQSGGNCREIGDVEACSYGVFKQLKNNGCAEQNALYRCSTVRIERNTNTHVDMCIRVFHPRSELDSSPISLTLGFLRAVLCTVPGGSLPLCPALGADAEGKAEGRQPCHRRAVKGGGITNAPNRAGLGLGRSSGGNLVGTEDRSAAVPRTLSAGIDLPVVFSSFRARDLSSIGVSA